MVVTGCLSFSATGSFRFPSRAAGVAVGPCSGPGQAYWDSTDGAFKVDLGPVGGPGPVIVHRPPTTPGGVPQPGGTPPWVVNAAPIPPVIGPQGTAFPDDLFGSMASAVVTTGLPTPGSPPTIVNSVYAFDPGIAAATVSRITVKPLSAGVATTDLPIDVRAGVLGATTVTFQNTDANLSGRFRNTVRAGDGVSDVILTTGNISTQFGNLTIAPAGLVTNVTGDITATLTVTGTTVQGGIGPAYARLLTVAGRARVDSGLGSPLDLVPDTGVVTIQNTANIGSPVGTEVQITNNSITTLSGILTIATAAGGANNLVLSPGGTGVIVPSSAFRPAVDNTLSVGTSALRFASVNAFLVSGTTVEGGTIGGSVVRLSTISGFPAITTKGADTTLYIWPAYAAAGTINLQGNVNVAGGAADPQLTVTSAVLGGFAINSAGSINLSGSGSLQISSTVVMTSGRVLNNLDVDGGATGMIVRLKGQTGAGVPNGARAPISNNREIQEYRDTTPGGSYLIWRNDAGDKFFVQGTAYA